MRKSVKGYCSIGHYVKPILERFWLKPKIFILRDAWPNWLIICLGNDANELLIVIYQQRLFAVVLLVWASFPSGKYGKYKGRLDRVL